MRLDVFGKQGCAKCESTKAKLGHYLRKWQLGDRVELAFVDMDTPDGMARGMFHDVFETIPVTIALDDNDQPLGRWEGVVPPSDEVAKVVGAD